MQSLDVYQSPQLIHLVGTLGANAFRVITFDRTNPSSRLADIVFAHPKPLDRRDLGILLRSRPSVDELRRGLSLTTSSLLLDPRRHDRQELTLLGRAACLLGIVRFLKGFYLVLVSEKRRVGYINGHVVYRIEQSRMHSIYCASALDASTHSKSWSWLRRNADPMDDAEERYVSLFSFVDLTKDFFFSYTYDLTNCLPTNLACKEGAAPQVPEVAAEFMWNFYLTQDLAQCLPDKASKDSWIIALIHGSFGQQRCSLYGSAWTLTILARRSRLYAGTRYLKRGVNEQGNVANHVEVEQIIESDRALASFCQVRGSIPLFWSQETSPTLPKPPIKRYHYDATFRATREHFGQLMDRHGAPIVVLNLVRQAERTPKESLIGEEYKEAVEFLNTGLNSSHRIVYEALDFKRASKAGESFVLRQLDRIAERALDLVGVFCSLGGKTQRGTVRVNCIDGLDRTNVGQFCVGLCALRRMLHAAGVAGLEPKLDKGGTLVMLFMDLFEQLGDTIAQQYGGSLAHKKGASAANALLARQREMLTSIQRYYSNSFTDFAKQDAINLFLGKFRPRPGGVLLWAMDSDFYLHNERVTNPLTFSLNVDIGVDHWYLGSKVFDDSDQDLVIRRGDIRPHSPLAEYAADALVEFDKVLEDLFFRPVQIIEGGSGNGGDEDVSLRLTGVTNSREGSDGGESGITSRGVALSSQGDSDGEDQPPQSSPVDDLSVDGVGGMDAPSQLSVAQTVVRAAASPELVVEACKDLGELASFCALTDPVAVYNMPPDPELVAYLSDFVVTPWDAKANLQVQKTHGPESVVGQGEFAGLPRTTEVADLYANPSSALVFDFAAQPLMDKELAKARLEKERALFAEVTLEGSHSKLQMLS